MSVVLCCVFVLLVWRELEVEVLCLLDWALLGFRGAPVANERALDSNA